ncbi:hypothetical protein BRC86_11080 [Halobacteriales archaeon QS_3_64_16]|nr:MAG: hypothetical protein BRC86_11080 [Halobacteriales archaeon QS_3_64_16]
MSDTNDREMGIELGDLNDDLEAHDYPVSSEELIEEYGDRELELPKGSETFAEIMEPVEEKTYEGADGVRQDVFNFVGSDAVGRENYSDRGTASDEVGGEDEPESL